MRFLLAVSVFSTAFPILQALQIPARTTEDADSYEIYSAVLQAAQIAHSNVSFWAIRNETSPYQFCLTPAPDQNALYRTMIDDYARKNAKTFSLARKFNPGNYALVTPAVWAAARPNRQTAIAAFSAVGFNPERTRGTVCFWAGSDGTCSVLLKSNGRWQRDQGWGGDGCFWAA